MVFNIPDTYISPYQTANCFKESNLDLPCLDCTAQIISEESCLVFKRIHEVLHVQATELGMFMICCKDRLQTGGAPNSLPLGYGMKGKSLSNSQLRFMINKVHNILHKENIQVLTEVYDGQWQSTVMSSESGKPLNLLWLQNVTWNPISKMSTG